MIRTFLLLSTLFVPLTFLLTPWNAKAQCCGSGGSITDAAMLPAPAQQKVKVKFSGGTGTVAAKLSYGDYVLSIPPNSDQEYQLDPLSSGAMPPLPGESTPMRLKNPSWNGQNPDDPSTDYTGTGEAEVTEEDKENEKDECDPKIINSTNVDGGDGTGDGKSDKLNSSNNKSEKGQDNPKNTSRGKKERPPITYINNGPQPPEQQTPGGGNKYGNTDSNLNASREGGMDADGGYLRYLPGTTTLQSTPMRLNLVQALGATSNGKQQTGYILPAKSANGSPLSFNPLLINNYRTRSVKQIAGSENVTTTERIIETAAGTTVQEQGTNSMTFSFYSPGVMPGGSVIPDKQQIITPGTVPPPNPSWYPEGYTIVTKEFGSTVSTRHIWIGSYISGTSINQLKYVKDVFSNGVELVEDWVSSHNTSATPIDRTVTSNLFYKVGGVDTAKSRKTTVYRLFDWGEGIIKETIFDIGGTSPLNDVTNYTWWSGVSASDPNYGRKLLVTYPDGSWEASYRERVTGTQDIIEHDFSSWKDSAVPSLTGSYSAIVAYLQSTVKSNCRYVETTHYADYSTQRREYVKGLLVGKMQEADDAGDPLVSIRKDFVDATHFFATVTVKNGSGFNSNLPLHVYRLKQDQTDHTVTGNIISHTQYRYQTGNPDAGSPGYSASSVSTAGDDYRIVDVLTDPERLPCLMRRTVTDRQTGRTVAVQEYVIKNLEDIGWGKNLYLDGNNMPDAAYCVELDRLIYTYNTEGHLSYIAYWDGRTEKWNYEVGTYGRRVTYKNALDVTTVTEIDPFGRVVLEAIQECATYSYTGALGSAITLPAQNWVVTRRVYTARSGSRLGTLATVTTSAVTTGGIGGTPDPSWSRVRKEETDGPGRTFSTTDELNRIDYWLYSTDAGGGRIITRSLNSSGTSPLSVTVLYRDGQLKSVTGTAVIDTWYTYDVPTAWKFTQTKGFDAALTASLGIVVTETDPLGRVTRITRPWSASGTTLDSPLYEERVYNNEGLLQRISAPGTGAGSFIHDLYDYSWGTGTSTSSPPRVVVSERSADTNIGDLVDTDRVKTENFLELSGGLWWEVTLRREGGDSVSPGRETREAVGPMNIVGGYSRTKVTSMANIEEEITSRIGTDSSSVHQTRRTRNGTQHGGQLTRNGLNAFVLMNSNMRKVVSYSLLRDPLLEPSPLNINWITRTVNPSTGLVTQRTGPETGETLDYYGAVDGHRAGRVKKRTAMANPGAHWSFYDYDAAGRLTKQWGKGINPASYTYDEWGRMTTMTTFRSGTGQTVDPDSNPTSWTPTAGTGDLTEWVYPPFLPLLSVKRLPGTSSPSADIAWTYRQNGQLKVRTWRNGITTTYDYHDTGKLSTINYSDSTPDVTYTWDRAGRNTGRTDAAGTWAMTYLDDGRLKKETTGAGLRSTEWNFDSRGRQWNLTAQVSSAAVAPTVYYGYDSISRLSTVTSGTSPTYEIWNSYSSTAVLDSNKTYKTNTGINTEGTQSRTHTTLGELATQSFSLTYGGADIPYFSYARNYDRITAVTREGSRKWNYEYDDRGQVKKSYSQFTTGGTEIMAGSQTQYTYDYMGNRTYWKEGGSSTLDMGLRQHKYGDGTMGGSANALNQYIAIERPQSFDVTGMRSSTASPVTVTATGTTSTPVIYQQAGTGLYFHSAVTHPSTNGLYTAVTATGPGVSESWKQYVAPTMTGSVSPYDLNGNLIRDGRWSYTWDAENRLTAMECSPQDTPYTQVKGLKLEFVYDGLSRRIEKKVYECAFSNAAPPYIWSLVKNELYQYDGWNLIVTARRNPTTGVITRHGAFAWGPDVGSLPYGRSDWQKAGGVGGLLLFFNGTASSSAYFIFSDRLGNVAGLATAAAPMGGVYDYDAFGREMRSSGFKADTFPFRFSSKFTDPESGLLYYGYRYYNAAEGRWISRDRIGENGGLNLYCAIENNPIKSYDYLGMITWGDFKNAVGSPYDSIVGKAESDAVNSQMKPRYGRDTDHGLVNALKHCVWSCRLSAYWQTGPESAKKITDGHEEKFFSEGKTQEDKDRLKRQKDMDLHNNAVGREAGKIVGPTASCYLDKCWDECEKAAREGKLNRTATEKPGSGNAHLDDLLNNSPIAPATLK